MFARLGLRAGAPAVSLTAPCVLNALEVGLEGVAGEITVLARRPEERRASVELAAVVLQNPAGTVRVEGAPSDRTATEFSEASLWVHFDAPVLLTRGGVTETCKGVFTLTEARDGSFSAKVTIRDPRDRAGKRKL